MFDSARQLVRWSMPGGTFALFLAIGLGCPVVVSATLAHFRGERYVLRVPADLGSLSTGAAAAIVASVIPLGFLIYQVYYQNFESVRGPGLTIVPADRGWKIFDRLRKMDGAGLSSLLADYPSARNSNTPYMKTDDLTRVRKIGPSFLRVNVIVLVRYRYRHRYQHGVRVNWHLVKCMLIDERLRVSRLDAETRTLSDFYHGIGATRSSLVFAEVITFLAYFCLPNLGPLGVRAIAAALILVISAGVYLALTNARQGVLRRLEDELVLGLYAAGQRLKQEKVKAQQGLTEARY